jgi:hypothetical protein
MMIVRNLYLLINLNSNLMLSVLAGIAAAAVAANIGAAAFGALGLFRR